MTEPVDESELHEPEGAEPYQQEVALFGGIACGRHRTSDAAVVAVLREGVERVVLASMGIELTWWTSAVTPDDDLESTSPTHTREGLDWAHVGSRVGNLETVTVTAIATAMHDFPRHPKYRPVCLRATFPRSWPGTAGKVGELRIGLSMHRWAMYGGGVDLDRVLDPLSKWLLDSTDALDADTGFLALDRMDAGYDFSPWEQAVGTLNRDVSTKLWGYGWGTLLGATHVAALGGIESLRHLTWARIEQRPEGRVWLTLTRDIAALDRADMRALREVLAPVLPPGSRTLETYQNDPPEPGVVHLDYLL